MADWESLMVLDLPSLVAQLQTAVPSGRVVQGVVPPGYHLVRVFEGSSMEPKLEGDGLDPRLALLDALQKVLPTPSAVPNWNTKTRKDPRSYLAAVSIRANVPDPEDLDPEVLKKAYQK